MGTVLLAFAVVVVLGLAGCESAPPAKPPEAPAAPATPTAAPSPAAPAVTAPPAPAPPPSVPAAAPPGTAPASPATPPTPEQAPVETVRVLFIKTSFANFRAAPGIGGRIVAVLRQGTRVEVIESRDQWYRVRLADGREGWVAESVTRE